MNITTVTGFVAGLLAIQFLPLPKWRLLVGLIPLGMIITGGDLLAVLNLHQDAMSPLIFWMSLGTGLLIGCGVGYFVKWFRFALFQRTSRRNKDEDGETVRRSRPASAPQVPTNHAPNGRRLG